MSQPPRDRGARDVPSIRRSEVIGRWLVVAGMTFAWLIGNSRSVAAHGTKTVAAPRPVLASAIGRQRYERSLPLPDRSPRFIRRRQRSVLPTFPPARTRTPRRGIRSRPASQACPVGLQDPQTGDATLRKYLNRNFNGTGGYPFCNYTLSTRTFSLPTTLSDPLYIMEMDVTVASGGTLTIPAGTSVGQGTDEAGNLKGGGGNLIVQGTAAVDGTFDTCALAYTVTVAAGGTLSGSGTFTKCASGADAYWGGIVFQAGSAGTLSGATIDYSDISVDGAGTSPTIKGGSTISNAGGQCVHVTNGGDPTLQSLDLDNCGSVAVVLYDSIPTSLNQDYSLNATNCGNACFILVPGGNYAGTITWGAPGLPIRVKSNQDIHITQDATLSVGAATVQFYNCALYVDDGGDLLLFDTTLTGTGTAPAYWQGVAFLPNSSGTLQGVTVQYAGESGLKDGVNAVKSYQAGILVSGASPTIEGDGNGGASTVTSAGGAGVEVANGGSPTLTGVAATNNTSYAFRYDFTPSSAQLKSDTSLTASGNNSGNAYYNLLYINAGASGISFTSDTEIPDVGLPITFDGAGTGTTIAGGTLTLDPSPTKPVLFLNGDVTVAAGATATFTRRNVGFKDNGLYVNGALNLQGYVLSGANLYYISSAEYALSLVSSIDTAGSWLGIAYLQGSNGALVGYGITGAGKASLLVSNCGIRSAYQTAVLVCGSSPSFTGRILVDHSAGNGVEMVPDRSSAALATAPILHDVHVTNCQGYAFQYDFPTTTLTNDSALVASSNGQGSVYNSVHVVSDNLVYATDTTVPDVGIRVVFDGNGNGLAVNGGTFTIQSSFDGGTPFGVYFLGGNVSVNGGTLSIVGYRQVGLQGSGLYVHSGATLSATNTRFLSVDEGLSSSTNYPEDQHKGAWLGIAYLPGSLGSLTASIVVDAGGSFLQATPCGSHQAAIVVCGSSPSIKDIGVSYSAGNGVDVDEVTQSAADPTISGNLTSNVGYAIEFFFCPDWTKVGLLSASNNGKNVALSHSSSDCSIYSVQQLGFVGIPIEYTEPYKVFTGGDVTVDANNDVEFDQGFVATVAAMNAHYGVALRTPTLDDDGGTFTVWGKPAARDTLEGVTPGPGTTEDTCRDNATCTLDHVDLLDGGASSPLSGCGDNADFRICGTSDSSLTNCSLGNYSGDGIQLDNAVNARINDCDLGVPPAACSASACYTVDNLTPPSQFRMIRPLERSLDTSTQVDSTYNWWGSVTGPTTPANPGGAGSPISAGISFSPWLGNAISAIALTAGWNSLGVPSPEYRTESQLIDDLQAQNPGMTVSLLATYADGRYSVFVPGYSPDVPLAPQAAVYALTSTGGSWTPGRMTAQSVALSLLQGWNFVSFSYPASSDAATVCSELKTQGRGCAEVAIYQNGAWQTYTPTSGTSFALSPAQGFMVYIPTAGTWTPQ